MRPNAASGATAWSSRRTDWSPAGWRRSGSSACVRSPRPRPSLLEEVIIRVERAAAKAELTLRWRGGLITELAIDLPHSNPPPIRTEEETIDLVRRLAVHYPDATIAGILNRQGRKTATGQRFTAGGVGNLRRYWKIPRFQPAGEPPQGPLVNIKEAAEILGVAPSTVHRWLNDGFIAGEQITPGAP